MTDNQLPVRTETGREELKEHFWISNPAFYRMTGVRWICMDCRIGVATRRDVVRKSCPGRPIKGIGDAALEGPSS